MIAHVEPFAEGACGSHTRRGWIRNSSGDSLPNRHKRSLRLVMPACKPSTPPSWRTRPNCTTWSCVRCAPAIRGPCSGFRLFGTNRDLTARALVMDPRGVLREKMRLHRLQSVKNCQRVLTVFLITYRQSDGNRLREVLLGTVRSAKKGLHQANARSRRVQSRRRPLFPEARFEELGHPCKCS
jgi:hypothetical protein